MFYIFKQTYLWDVSKKIDESCSSRTVKAKSEAKARRKLPVRVGREWVLVGTKRKK